MREAELHTSIFAPSILHIFGLIIFLVSFDTITGSFSPTYFLKANEGGLLFLFNHLRLIVINFVILRAVLVILTD